MRPILCPVLVGREAELEDVRVRLDRTVEGHGGVLLIAGEAGVGKSRLARELRLLAELRGLRTLTGRAVETSAALAWRPIAEALAEAEREHGLPDVAGLRPYLPALEALIHGSGGHVQPADPSTLIACEGLVRLLGALAGRDGVLVVLEDLHWADPETMAAVEYLADNLHAHPVLCVVTLREGEPGPAVQRFDRLRGRRAVETLTIPPLTAPETERLVREALGSAPPAALADLVHDRSDGLPLLAEEVLADLAASGSLRRDDTVWLFTGDFRRLAHSTVPEIVRRRLSVLAEEDRAVLEAAAVLGRRFDWRLLPAIVESGEEAVLATLRRCVDAQLVRAAYGGDAQSFQFRHALTRDAVLASLLPPDRARLARLAARTIATQHPGLPGWWCELSADLMEMAGEADAAASLLLRSASRALDRGAVAAAQVDLARAGALASNEELVADVEATVTEAAAQVGDRPTAVETGTRLLARLRRLRAGDERLAAVHLCLARAHLAVGALAEAESAVAEAGSLAEAPSIAAQVRLMSAEIVIERRDVSAARALAESALELSEPAGLAEITCEALAVIGRAVRASSLDASMAALLRGLEVAEANDMPLWRLRCLQELGVTENLRSGGIRHLPEARELAVRLGAVFTLAAIDLGISVGYAWSEPAAGLEAADRAIETSRRLQLRLLPILLVVKGLLLAQLGRSAEAESSAIEAKQLAPGDVDIEVGADAYVAGHLLLVRDDLDGALACFEPGVQRLREAGAANAYPFCGMWALIRAVRLDLSGPVGDALPPGALVNEHNRGNVLLAEAVLAGRAGHRQEAERLFAAGEPLLAPAPWAQHHSHRILAEAAIADGWGRPVEWLRAAATYFDTFGHDVIARSCRALLRKTGVPVPRAGRGDSAVPPALTVYGVTRREMDVLRLIADGVTNREIAGRLYLSEHTVETHVGSLLSKTGSAGRAQLAVLLTRIPEAERP